MLPGKQRASIFVDGAVIEHRKARAGDGGYLMGKQELFNDSLSGGEGFYGYEEVPHGGAKTGIFGRGIAGLTDSVLKDLGI